MQQTWTHGSSQCMLKWLPSPDTDDQDFTADHIFASCIHHEAVLQVTRRYNLLLHVDACLGGFVLPFARKLGHPISPFDFSVKGVTSMSVDTHKFGMAHKGTSVVLYHHRELRQHQYTKITEWTGGLYISPGRCL